MSAANTDVEDKSWKRWKLVIAGALTWFVVDARLVAWGVCPG